MLCQKNHPPMPYHPNSVFRFLSTLLLLPCLFFSSLAMEAQEKFIPQPARLITSFPFTVFTGGVILIRARLGDYPDSLNFILDTGSGGISLDSATCERLKLTPLASDAWAFDAPRNDRMQP